MEEKTADEVAQIFSAAGDSVTLINGTKEADETDLDFDKIDIDSPLSSSKIDKKFPIK